MPLDDATVRFEEKGTLALATGETRAIAVLGEPAAPWRVGFALIGEPRGGYLEPAVVTADAMGRAVVDLHAPDEATTFHVRASLLDTDGAPGPSAERAVAVSAQGFGTVRVKPVYSGKRSITEWTASVVAVATCADLAPTLPEEPSGALTATSPAASAPLVEDAPVGPNLAVVVRAGHFAWGCTNTSALTAGATMDVSVTVIDKPLDLASANLAATFSWDPAALLPLLADAGVLLGEAFLPSGSKVGSVMLNTMASLVPQASQGSFAAQRIDKSWDALAAQHFAALSPGLRQRFDLWTAAGLSMQSPSFAASLTAGAAPGEAALALTRFGDVDAAAAGVPMGAKLAWNAEPNDTVLLAGAFAWEPSRFAGAAALAAAQADVVGAASVPDALTTVADCEGLAGMLGGFTGCDVSCVEQLCVAALGARFAVALNASKQAGTLGEISLKASADATVGDAAEPTHLSGHWIGSISDGVLAVTVDGDLTAAPPQPQ